MCVVFATPHFFFVMPRCDTLAQDPEKKKLVVREVCNVGVHSTTALDRDQNGFLTHDGKELLVVDPFKKLSLYKSKDLTEQIVKVSPFLISAYSEPITGGVFVQLSSEMKDVEKFRKDKEKTLDLVYFENTDCLVSWNPTWTRKVAFPTLQKSTRIQWVSGIKSFAIYDTSKAPAVTFVDALGNTVGVIQIPGTIIGGLDTGEDGVEVFFLSRGMPDQIMRAIVDSTFRKIKRIEVFSSIGASHNLNTLDSRQIRMRGLKTGDVRKYIQLIGRPDYWQRQDLDKVDLPQIHRVPLKDVFARATIGKLSSYESAYEYEISPHAFPPVYIQRALSFHGCPVVYRRSDGFEMLPQGTTAVDAVQTTEGLVISLRKDSNGNDNSHVRLFSVCTLGVL